MRILIVEDEKRLAGTIKDILEDAGYHADTAGDGLLGLEMAENGIYDAIILDVMLPELDGFHVLERLRQEQNSIPVLMLTARSSLNDRVHGLDCGADYYLTKPFANEELLACLRTILRRPAPLAPEVLTFGDLSLSPELSQLTCQNNTVTLTARELELMRLFLQNSRQILPKETILLKLWGYDASVQENSVEAYISFLRKKLVLLRSTVKISAVRGIGYKLEVTP